MPFIGQQPITGAYSKLDSITTSATATYNLQLNGGAYYPQSANHLLVSLNGVMQAPQDSFTVSGSQITFASALTSSDSIDFIMALGDVLDIGVPSDGSVNTSQLANSAVTDAKIASGITASKLTGALPAIDGASLSNVIPDTIFTHAYLGGLQTLTNDTVTKINYNTQGPYNGLQWDTSNYKVTFDSTNAGKYLVSFGVAAFSGTNTFRELGLRPYKNGSQIREILTLVNGTSGGVTLGSVRHVLGHYTMILDFNDTDYFEVYAQFEVGSGNADAHSYNYGSEIFLTRIGD